MKEPTSVFNDMKDQIWIVIHNQKQTLRLDLHLLALESCKYVDPMIGIKVYLCLMDMPKELVAFVIPSISTLPELSHQGISWRNEWIYRRKLYNMYIRIRLKVLRKEVAQIEVTSFEMVPIIIL